VWLGASSLRGAKRPKQSIFFSSAATDCFASLAMTALGLFENGIGSHRPACHSPMRNCASWMRHPGAGPEANPGIPCAKSAEGGWCDLSDPDQIE
jgi:hypothetical protein